MTPTSVFPCFLVSLLLLAVSRLMVRRVAFCQRLIQDSGKAHYTALDGLRGFLALGVFFYHAVINYFYFQTGIWTHPPSSFYQSLGTGAVSCFFMITGFLFWSKIIDKKLAIKKFYVGRILRIYPLYISSILLLFIIVSVLSGFTLKTSWLQLICEGLNWLTCGLVNISAITRTTAQSLNAINTIPINAGVQWTLVYEVRFYLILPLLARFVKPSRFIFLFVTVLALNYFFPIQPIVMALIFLGGMGAAYIVKQFRLENVLSRPIFSGVALLLLATLPFCTSHLLVFNAIVFIIFLLIIYGNNLFGLLTAPASRYLGSISYSIYLLHGIVLFCVFQTVDRIYPIAGMETELFWLLTGLCGLIVITASSVTYRLIEHPFSKKSPSPKILPETVVLAMNKVPEVPKC